MQSFHQSRVRICFEVLCAFTVSASCVGAWMQLGATAFLPAAAVAALYGLIRACDMIRRKPGAVEAVPEAAEPAPTPASVALVPSEPVTASDAEEEKSVAPAPAKTVRKKPRKSKAAQPVAAPEIVRIVPVPEVAEPMAEAEAVEPQPPAEPEYAPIAPLFEPEPFVRQQRAGFGRKAG